MKKGSKFNLEYPIVILQDDSRRQGPGDDERKQALNEAITILKKVNKEREKEVKKRWERISKIPKYRHLGRN